MTSRSHKGEIVSCVAVTQVLLYCVCVLGVGGWGLGGGGVAGRPAFE